MNTQICYTERDCIFKSKEEATGDTWYECKLCAKAYSDCVSWQKHNGGVRYQLSLSDVAKEIGTMLWIDDPENKGKFLTMNDINKLFEEYRDIWAKKT